MLMVLQYDCPQDSPEGQNVVMATVGPVPRPSSAHAEEVMTRHPRPAYKVSTRSLLPLTTSEDLGENALKDPRNAIPTTTHTQVPRKIRASSNPVRQTRASMLRAQMNQRSSSMASKTTSAKKGGSHLDLTKSKNGSGPSPGHRLTSPNGFEESDPFTEKSTSTVQQQHISRKAPSPMNEDRRPNEDSINLSWSGQSLLKSETQISITSSLLSTPGRTPLIERVDTVNACLFWDLSESFEGSLVGYATKSSDDFQFGERRNRDAAVATSFTGARMVNIGDGARRNSYHGSPKANKELSTSRTMSLTNNPRPGAIIASFKKSAAAEAPSTEKVDREEKFEGDTRLARDMPRGNGIAANDSGVRKPSLTIAQQKRIILGRDSSNETSSTPDHQTYTRLNPSRNANPSTAGTKKVVHSQRNQVSARKGSTPNQPQPIGKKAVSTARLPRRSPTVETPTKKNNLRQPMFPAAKKPAPLSKMPINVVSPNAPSQKLKKPMQQAVAASRNKVSPVDHISASRNNDTQADHISDSRNKVPQVDQVDHSTVHRNQRAYGLRSPDLSPEQRYVIENPTGIPIPHTKSKPLADISGLGVSKNPRPSLGLKWLGLKGAAKSPNLGVEGFRNQKENVRPSTLSVPSPGNVLDREPSSKSKKHLGIKEWFHKSPRNSHGSHFSGKSFLKFGKPAEGKPAPVKASELSTGYGFTTEEVENLKTQLKTDCPGGDGGMNTVAGRYYSEKVPSFDESPSRDEKDGNPIAVAMELIHSARVEPDKAKSKRLFALSKIIVEAVTKSHDARVACVEAKKACTIAELANAEVNLKLHECVAWVQAWKNMMATK